MEIKLEHDRFESAKVLADIGAKISAGKAALSELELGKADFLDTRAAEATKRIDEVLAQSKEVLVEIGGYYSELVGYRNQVDNFLGDVRYLIQSVEGWKRRFDDELAAKSAEIDTKIVQNSAIVAQIKAERETLATESASIGKKREALGYEMVKINDEWQTLTRASKEINK